MKRGRGQRVKRASGKVGEHERVRVIRTGREKVCVCIGVK